jgi:LacI family transcriptional regulator
VPVTMRDVAHKAGVSIKTVSRVVNEQGEISDLTRERVLAAIDSLGYRPSKVARALVTRRTDTIGLIFGDIANPYLSEVARGVLDTAVEEKIEVFICNTDGDPESEKRALNSMLDHNVDGAIVFPLYANRDWIQEIAQPDHPLVLMNCDIVPRPGLGLVATEMRKGARLAVDYLAQKGHSCIGMLAGEVAPKNKIQRVQGYRDGLELHGIQYRDEFVLIGGTVIEFGKAGARQLLSQYPEITALFCYNDLIAMGAIEACKEMGRRVPDDCAIVGFDDIRFSPLVNPPITTVHVDKYEIGRQAAIRLLDMLKNPGAVYPPTIVDVELIIRESA